MLDRQPTKPGRIKLTDDSGNIKYYTMERADEPTTEGTPVNKATLFNSVNENRYGCELPSKAFELLVHEWRVNVLASGWSTDKNSGGYYTQTITVAGMRETYCPKYMPSDEALSGKFLSINKMITNNGSVTFFATHKPTVNIAVRIVGV